MIRRLFHAAVLTRSASSAKPFDSLVSKQMPIRGKELKPMQNSPQPLIAPEKPTPDIHAKPIFLDPIEASAHLGGTSTTVLDRLHWIPSEMSEKRRLDALEERDLKRRSPFTSTYLPPECKVPESLPASVTIAPKEINPYYPLPLPPKETTISTAEDEQRMQEFNATVAAIIPPNDPLQIPLELSKPWFGFALKAYCVLLAAVVILMGDWERMTNGYPNCFTGIQTAFWSWYDGLWAIGVEEEEQLIRQRFESALNNSSLSGEKIVPTDAARKTI
jgi:hypothetical protein